MKDLIQRLRGVGHDYDFHGNALICEASDALEKQQVEIERLKIQWAKLSEAVYLLSEGNVTLIKERDSLKVQINELASAHSNVLRENDALKAQAAKDSADAGRYRFLEYQCSTGEYRGIISRNAIDAAMKESQS